MALPLFFLFLFKKKLTVIGIIGHTQGVIKAISPPINPAPKIYRSDLLDVSPAAPKALTSSMTGVQRFVF